MKPFDVKGQRQRINVAAALILGADFLMILAALMLVLSPQSYDLSVVAPHIASAMLMTVFGPYLFVASGNALLTMLLMVIHLVLLWALVNRVRFFDGFGRWSGRGRLFAFTAGAVLSVLSVWCEIPVTERYEIASDKIGGVKTSVCSWFHRADEVYAKGAQIDLLIDRADQVVTVCEMKYARKAQNVIFLDQLFAEISA